MDSGNIEFLTLVGYSDNAFSQTTGDSYTALFNPENFNISYATQNSSRSGQGSSEEQRAFNKRSPQTVSFKIIIDGTGILPASSGVNSNATRTVAQDIATLKQVVYGYDSTTHMPTFVQIRWGKILFNAQLDRMSISYKLFKADGTPIRAEADCSFQGVIDDDKLAALENKQSPDLTHVRTVIKGDNLSLICYREYGDSSYYYQVAKFNRLTDFKKLTPGTKLILPPVTSGN